MAVLKRRFQLTRLVLTVAFALVLMGCATGGVLDEPTGVDAGPSDGRDPQPKEPSLAPSFPTPATFDVGDVITITEDGEPWATFSVLEVRQDAEFADPDGFYNDSPSIEGYVYLSARVRYEALVDGVTYNPFDFQVFVDMTAVDSYAIALNGPEPQLSSGELPSGRAAEGWLLYEVPPVGEVLLSYSGGIFSNQAPVFEVVIRNE